MDTKAIRTKVLDLAVRGMLTRRRPDDGAAEDLLAQIQTEKQALIAAGRIKREKPLLEITEEEKPFEVPEQWKWVRLGDYVEKVTDQVASGSFAALRENVVSKKTPDYAIMVKTADFSNGFTKNLTYTDKHGYEFLENSNLYGGELILSNVGSIGKCFIVPELEYKMTLAPNAVMIRLTSNELRDFLYYFILSSYGQSELQSITTGVAMQKFNKTELKTILIPVPPLPEQLRIVANIDQIFTILDTIDTLQGQYQDNLATLKSKIIDAGIQGKLTEQLPEDGNAEELYQQIQREKLALEEAGKIKKSKPLPPISDEEKPFDIPDNWKWVRLADVYEINPKVNADDNINAAFIPMERISAGFDRSFSYVVQKWSEASKNHTRFCDGDVAFAKISPCFENRKSFVVENLPNSLGGGTTELIILRQKLIDPLFTYYLILDERFIRLGLSTYKGTVGQQRIKNDVMFAYVFPLPPLAEQKRIVAKLEELLPLCEG